MTYKTLDAYNTSEGLHVLFYYVADVVPGFVPLVLFAFWTIATFGSFFAQKRIEGRGSFQASFAVGSYATTVAAVMLSLIPNMISLSTLVMTFGISIAATIWLVIPSGN